MAEPSEIRQGPPDRIVAWLSNAAVAGARQIEHFKDTILCEPAEPAEFVFYVQRGQVRVHHFSSSNTERFQAILGPGAWVGVAALAKRPQYSIRARVIAQSLVWQIPATPLLHALAATPGIAATMVTQLADRLFESYEEASRLVFHDADRRLVLTLLDFSKSAAAIKQADGITLQITHQELAQAVGAARETVSIALNTLRERNLVRTSRNRVTFNPQALKRFAAAQAAGA
jgi:CRP/FNR family transcriptional regulator